MKILFDARYMPLEHLDGIGRYSAELGTALSRLTDITFIISSEIQLKYLPKDCDFIKIHTTTSLKEPFTAFILNRYKPDVVFSPLQTMGSFGRKYKLILSLHDIIYYRYHKPPTWLSPPIRLGWWLFHQTYTPQRVLLNAADAVVTVSETSKQEILERRLTKRPVIVVPNAPNDLHKYLKKDVDISQPPENLVYMGSFMPYKNVETLIKGMKHLPSHKLHLLSKITPKRKTELKQLIEEDAVVIFHNGVSDEEYAKVLSDKALLVNASLAEGYGLPIAEAMTLGVPSVITDMEIFHEVGGKGALYFDPHDENDFVNKINEASRLETYQKLSKVAGGIGDKFSWTESAKILLKSIQDLSS